MTTDPTAAGFISERECNKCNKYHLASMSSIREAQADIRCRQDKQDENVAEILGDLREIKTILKEQNKQEQGESVIVVNRKVALWDQGMVQIAKTLLPWFVMAGALIGAAYNAVKAPDPAVIQATVEAAAKAFAEQYPELSAKP